MSNRFVKLTDVDRGDRAVYLRVEDVVAITNVEDADEHEVGLAVRGHGTFYVQEKLHEVLDALGVRVGKL